MMSMLIPLQHLTTPAFCAACCRQLPVMPRQVWLSQAASQELCTDPLPLHSSGRTAILRIKQEAANLSCKDEILPPERSGGTWAICRSRILEMAHSTVALRVVTAQAMVPICAGQLHCCARATAVAAWRRRPAAAAARAVPAANGQQPSHRHQQQPVARQPLHLPQAHSPDAAAACAAEL